MAYLGFRWPVLVHSSPGIGFPLMQMPAKDPDQLIRSEYNDSSNLMTLTNNVYSCSRLLQLGYQNDSVNIKVESAHSAVRGLFMFALCVCV